MHHIKQLKAWAALQAAGYTIITYRFNHTIVGYGASLYSPSGAVLVDIEPVPGMRPPHKWQVRIDESLLSVKTWYTLTSKTCLSREILSTIDNLKAGLVHMKTRYVEGRGLEPVYGSPWPS